MATDPMWVFENYAFAAAAIDELKAELAKLRAGHEPAGYFCTPFMKGRFEQVDSSCSGDADVFPLYRAPQPSAVPDEPMKPAAVVNDHYSRDGVNDEISAFLPVGTQLYTARQLEDLRSVLALERARYYELFAEFMAAAPSAPATVPSVNQQLIKALEAVLNSGRGTSGRIILDAQDEADVRAAIAAARKGGREGMSVCLICPHCEELFDDEDEWFEHVCECIEQRLDRVEDDDQ